MIYQRFFIQQAGWWRHTCRFAVWFFGVKHHPMTTGKRHQVSPLSVWMPVKLYTVCLLSCLKFYLVSWVPCNKKATCLYIATRDWDTLNICANNEEIGSCSVAFSTIISLGFGLGFSYPSRSSQRPRHFCSNMFFPCLSTVLTAETADWGDLFGGYLYP